MSVPRVLTLQQPVPANSNQRSFFSPTPTSAVPAVPLGSQPERAPVDRINGIRRDEGIPRRREAGDADLQRVAVLHRHMLAHEREGVTERLALDHARLTNLVRALEGKLEPRHVNILLRRRSI